MTTRLLTPKELAKRWSVSQAHVHALVRGQALAAVDPFEAAIVFAIEEALRLRRTLPDVRKGKAA